MMVLWNSGNKVFENSRCHVQILGAIKRVHCREPKNISRHLKKFSSHGDIMHGIFISLVRNIVLFMTYNFEVT